MHERTLPRCEPPPPGPVSAAHGRVQLVVRPNPRPGVAPDRFAQRGGSTICVQRNSAIVRPVASLVTAASQTWVWRPR